MLKDGRQFQDNTALIDICKFGSQNWYFVFADYKKNCSLTKWLIHIHGAINLIFLYSLYRTGGKSRGQRNIGLLRQGAYNSGKLREF